MGKFTYKVGVDNNKEWLLIGLKMLFKACGKGFLEILAKTLGI